jgi:hypothetical protein
LYVQNKHKKSWNGKRVIVLNYVEENDDGSIPNARTIVFVIQWLTQFDPKLCSGMYRRVSRTGDASEFF